MKNYLFIFFFFIGLSFSNSNKKPIDPKKEKKILEIIYNQLKTKHLIDKKIDDDFSKKVFKTYMDSIDSYKVFLLQSDITEFKKFETKLDDQLLNNDLSFFYLTYDRLKIRMQEGKIIYINLLKNKLDIKVNEKDFDEKNLSFTKNKTEQIERWKLLLKSEVFSQTIKDCEKENANQKLTKQGYNELFENLAIKNLENLGNRLEYTTMNVDNFTRELLFEKFINGYVLQFDIHSRYFIPLYRDEYMFKQTGKTVGIGIMTANKESFVQVKVLAVGGPAIKTKKIDVGDIILKVGQENEEPIDVVGYSLYDVAKLTRGKSGTTVKLTLKKADGSIEVVSIKRAIVSSNDSYIKSCLVEKNNIKYAVISFPRFYNDFDDDMSRNVSDDFEEELQILKESDVQGIIIDIRGNAGGSVEESAKILSNFIDKKTILQVKNRENKIFEIKSEFDVKKWDKSLVLVVDNQTASAAEIFASAFQDFNVGVVIGQETFGKGTIQEFIDINTFNSKKDVGDDFGMLKMTTQKFYRPNGKSVQKNGVVPNIFFPINSAQSREKDLKNALNSDEIKASEFVKINGSDYFTKINSKISARINSNQYFNSLKQLQPSEITFNNISVNFELIKSNHFKFLEKQNAIIEPIASNVLDFKSTPADVKLFKRNEYLIAKRKNWYNELKSDMIIDEGLNVLEDMYLKK